MIYNIQINKITHKLLMIKYKCNKLINHQLKHLIITIHLISNKIMNDSIFVNIN